MRSLLPLFIIAVILSAAAPSSAVVPIGHPGPHAGLVAEGQSNTHHYASDVAGNPCIPMIAQFIVTVDHVPASAALRLEAGGESAESVDGQAVVSFYASWCTTFPIDVTGIVVDDVAAYTVTVERIGGAA